MENKFFGNEGVLNRRLWPIPTLAYLSSSTLTASADVVAASNQPVGAIVAASNTANTVGNDVIEVTTATSAIDAGDTDPFLATAPATNNASAECVNLVACLNAWMATTPLAPAAIVLSKRF